MGWAALLLCVKQPAIHFISPRIRAMRSVFTAKVKTVLHATSGINTKLPNQLYFDSQMYKFILSQFNTTEHVDDISIKSKKKRLSGFFASKNYNYHNWNWANGRLLRSEIENV